MEHIKLELYCLNDDDYFKLQSLMRAVSGTIDVTKYEAGKRVYVDMTFDMSSVARLERRKGGRKRKSVVAVDKNGNEILDNRGMHTFYMPLDEVERMIDEQGAVEVAKKFNMSRATLFRKLKRAREDGDNIFM